MRIIILLTLGAMLSGCMVVDRQEMFYTRSEVDAITARAQCKAMARNLVQIYRCER